MRTIEWQVNDACFHEESQPNSTDRTQKNEKMTEENDKQAYQLKKYRDPSRDTQRQEILSVVEAFGILLSHGDLEKIATDLLTEDLEVFILSSTGKTPVQHHIGPLGFIELYKKIKIQHRGARSIDVDSEKGTAWQICEYNIVYEDDNNSVGEVACEVFTIRDKKICKYRASFGRPEPSVSDFEKFMTVTRKEKMLAKVKEINYALAGQPDFEKMVSLLSENLEYRFWRWGDNKCFTLCKNNFTVVFGQLQEEMEIRSIVPYDLSVDTQQKFVSAIYVYNLEERLSGKRFVWISTCVYGFDPNVNLTEMTQQGEIFPEGECDLHFESYTREFLAKRINDYLQIFDVNYNAFYNETVLYDCKFYAFMPQGAPNPGYHEGMKHFEKLEVIINAMKNIAVNTFGVIETYVDHSNPSYDVVFVTGCTEATTLENKKGTLIFFTKYEIENGKIAKQLDFLSGIPEPIKSPFDDKSFKCLNIE